MSKRTWLVVMCQTVPQFCAHRARKMQHDKIIYSLTLKSALACRQTSRITLRACAAINVILELCPGLLLARDRRQSLG